MVGGSNPPLRSKYPVGVCWLMDVCLSRRNEAGSIPVDRAIHITYLGVTASWNTVPPWKREDAGSIPVTQTKEPKDQRYPVKIKMLDHLLVLLIAMLPVSASGSN